MEKNNNDGQFSAFNNNMKRVNVHEDENHKKNWEEFDFDAIPPGCRFVPTDEELAKYYLRRKVEGLSLPPNQIHEVDLYSYHPKELAETYKEQSINEWWLFTSRFRKYPKGMRPNRSAPGGYWKPTGCCNGIPDTDTGMVLATVRRLDFYEGKCEQGKRSIDETKRTDWKIIEYLYPEDQAQPSSSSSNGDNRIAEMLDECILCKLYLKRASKDANDNAQDAKGRAGKIANNPGCHQGTSSTGNCYNDAADDDDVLVGNRFDSIGDDHESSENNNVVGGMTSFPTAAAVSNFNNTHATAASTVHALQYGTTPDAVYWGSYYSGQENVPVMPGEPMQMLPLHYTTLNNQLAGASTESSILASYYSYDPQPSGLPFGEPTSPLPPLPESEDWCMELPDDQSFDVSQFLEFGNNEDPSPSPPPPPPPPPRNC